MSIAILSLGTNVGDRAANIKLMEEELQKISKTPIKFSPLYESAPVDVNDAQKNYYNKAVRIETDLSPKELLEITQKIEKKLGRKSKNDKAPRTADIDILLFDEITVNLPELTIPHPRMFFRKFAIEGVKSVAADLKNPLTGNFFANYSVCKEVLRQKITLIE
jgi:2-amino-4-hydroxy-6-hydroxymethyldihydropteridine diphosphokinase